MRSLECFEEGTGDERHDVRYPIIRRQDSPRTDAELVALIEDPRTGAEDREIHKELLESRQARSRS